MYVHFFKRLIDIVLSSIGIILLAIPMLIISIAIKIDSPGSVFYRAERGGYKGKSFKIFKFRTMVQDADKIGGGTTALGDSRITRVGNILRKTKLDETANLFSIIKGDMSFIGPRPELLRYTNNYTEEEKVILSVRPGITDYSSIEFINLDEVVGAENADEYYENCVLKRKNELRIKYAQNVSFKTDVILFWKTVSGVLKKTFKFLFVRKEPNGVHNA